MRRSDSIEAQHEIEGPNHVIEENAPRSAAETAIGRWSLAISGVAVVAIVAIAVLGDIGVGLSEPPPLADDFSQRVIDSFERHEEWYLLYGRWEDIALAAAFAGLLIAVPFVNGTSRSRQVLVAGAGITVVGEVIDLSQLIGIDVARFALENGHMADFGAGNMYRIGINHTAAFITVAGLLVIGVGMMLTARDARSKSWWKTLNGLFGVSLIVTGLADISSNAQLFVVAEYATAGLALVWIVTSSRRVSGGRQASH